nr:ribosomal protein L9 [Boldiaceae sp.]
MSKKTIAILLLQEKKDLGNIGLIRKVSLGYARNYLIPKGIGCVVTPKIQIAVNKQIAIEKENNNKAIVKARELLRNLSTINKFSLKKKVGANNFIFGSITEKEISDLILKSTGENLDKKNISIPNIKTIGIYQINIKLHKDIYAQITLQVIPEKS